MGIYKDGILYDNENKQFHDDCYTAYVNKFYSTLKKYNNFLKETRKKKVISDKENNSKKEGTKTVKNTTKMLDKNPIGNLSSSHIPKKEDNSWGKKPPSRPIENNSEIKKSNENKHILTKKGDQNWDAKQGRWIKEEKQIESTNVLPEGKVDGKLISSPSEKKSRETWGKNRVASLNNNRNDKVTSDFEKEMEKLEEDPDRYKRQKEKNYGL